MLKPDSKFKSCRYCKWSDDQEEVEKKIGELYVGGFGGWGERRGERDINIAGRGAAVRKLPLGVTNSNVGIRRRYQKGMLIKQS